jgi:hypothetical protein
MDKSQDNLAKDEQRQELEQKFKAALVTLLGPSVFMSALLLPDCNSVATNTEACGYARSQGHGTTASQPRWKIHLNN